MSRAPGTPVLQGREDVRSRDLPLTVEATGHSAMTPVAAILARAEEAGVLLRLGPDGVVLMEGPQPPDGLLADVRRYWDAVRSALKARRDMVGVAPPPGWLEGIALAIRAALTAGARQETDADGWLYFTTPDGGRLTVAPDTLTQVIHSGLLLPLLAEADAPAEAAEPEEAGA